MTTLREQIDGIMGVAPDAEAVEFNGRWHSWGELRRAMRQLGGLLSDTGLGEGARVGVMLRNRPENIASILEMVSSERCLVTLNPILPDDRLSADVAKVEAPAIVAAVEDWQRSGVEAAARASGALCIEFGRNPEAPLAFALRPGIAADPSKWTRPFSPGIAIEMLTSGTTGPAKRIPLPRRAFEIAMEGWGSFEKGRADSGPRLRSGTQIWHNPLSHIAGIGGMLNIVLSGRKFCLLERFNVERFHDAIVRHRPKVVNGPPTAVRMLLDANLPKEDFASIVTFRTGTAPLDPDLADAFYERYGIPVLQNYGATEFAGGVAGWTMEDFKQHRKDKRGSVGRLNAGVEAHAVDPESGEQLPPGQQGLLELRSPQLGDGKSWLRTTDLAVVDADGFVWINGRADNAIIRGGYKITPDEVVRALEAHPAIREASVVGLPDARLGQVPVAAVKLAAGAARPSDKELDDFLRARLSPYQVPARMLYVEEFPRTASLKIDQAALKKLFA
jgi:acyl-CoA synthetase (AMP-forming)/AMP-acid ligase II